MECSELKMKSFTVCNTSTTSAKKYLISKSLSVPAGQFTGWCLQGFLYPFSTSSTGLVSFPLKLHSSWKLFLANPIFHITHLSFRGCSPAALVVSTENHETAEMGMALVLFP